MNGSIRSENSGKSQRLQTELSWKFKSASHFLVFIYDSRYEFDIEEAAGKLEEEGITDKEIATGKRRPTCIPEKMEVPVILCPGEGVCTGQKDHDPSGTENEKGNSL